MERLFTLFSLFIVLNLVSYGRNPPLNATNHRASGSGNGNSTLHEKSADCAPATSITYIELNNVSALIETGGLMWQDRATGNPAYEIPVGSGNKYLFTGGLWMGGVSPDGQLKLAAQLFGTVGQEFWPGPLEVNRGTENPAAGRLEHGSAEIKPDVCAEYDKFFPTTRTEVARFRAWYACKSDPDCDENDDFPNYDIPTGIKNWPANGDITKNQDRFLAPFVDTDSNGTYDPEQGDHPDYDLDRTRVCGMPGKVPLYGDFNFWWIFNDKGNIHNESGGDQIGMEIRAQAFGFTTNDEINNMTFYNYEMINRASKRLTETYFSVFVDADIGTHDDDYIGCDVARGVGYAYNGEAIDDGENNAIGANPGAIGVDFFEGPYQDNDGLDNPLTTDIQLAIAEKGIPYEGLGIGYGDGIIDNERLGMKRFNYFTNPSSGGPSWGWDPDYNNPSQFYNYLSGKWRDVTDFVWGGSGHQSSINGALTPTNYCFPGDSDPYFWSTGGVPVSPANWSEKGEDNAPGDRRFLEVAGPFTLEPGALNNITVGIVYGRGSDGDPFSSVRELLKADDKAQLLFNSCFRIVDGPDAPDLTIQELDKELILYLSNRKDVSNNYRESPEDYSEIDPSIIEGEVNTTITYLLDTLGQYYPDTLVEAVTYDRTYDFEGYQIYQLKSEDIGPDELQNPTQARLVAQCDIKNGIKQIINYEFDADLNAAVPVEKVNGTDEGIRHSFRITEDLFAAGNTRLINHKKYYFMAIAYGYNNFKTYDEDNTDGQQKPYLAGRKQASGAIKPVIAIPHIPAPELGGTDQLSEFGDGPEITRIEGKGNGGNELALTTTSEENIVYNFTPQRVTYQGGAGPINVKVIDPLNVAQGIYTLKFIPDPITSIGIDQARWILTRAYEGSIETIESESTIQVANEQLIPEWGISVTIAQKLHASVAISSTSTRETTELISSAIEFADPTKRWLSGVADVDGEAAQNWIRSGTIGEVGGAAIPTCTDVSFFDDVVGWDDEEIFESVADGSWAPFKLASIGNCYHAPLAVLGSIATLRSVAGLKDLSSVDIVLTPDRSKWTRCVVLETQDNLQLSLNGSTYKLQVKRMPSKDKYGKAALAGSGTSNNEEAANFISNIGMSWFPGYAIDLETGERLNMAFGEDSWLGNEGGNDMLFNPSDRTYTNFNEVLFGGKHYVYIFRNLNPQTSISDFGTVMPAYDHGKYMKEQLIDGTSITGTNDVFSACTWIGMPMLSQSSKGLSNPSDPYSYIETEARVKIRVAKEYARHSINSVHWKNPSDTILSQNNWYPLYEFNLENLATATDNDSVADSVLSLINVVPNPYYAYSNYEFDRLDNIIKIVNLPDQCSIRIYNVSGTLVRTFSKDSPITSIDWDLKNHVGISIASGVYIIHVDVPGVGERVLKWFGVMRPPDLENF